MMNLLLIIAAITMVLIVIAKLGLKGKMIVLYTLSVL